MIPKSQRLANKRWCKNHPRRQRLYSDHSAAKRYVRHSKNVDHLKQLINLIKIRIKEL